MTISLDSILGAISKHLTVLGTIAATIITGLTAWNTYTVNRIQKDVSKLDLRVKTEKLSSDFADKFIDKVMAHERVKGDERSLGALLTILNITAQASSAEDARSEAETRRLIPINLALILNESGCVAALDADAKYVEKWVGTAMSDATPRTLSTAIRALRGITMREIEKGNVKAAYKCLTCIDELINALPQPRAQEPVSTILTEARATRYQLISFILATPLASQDKANSDAILAYAQNKNKEQSDIESVLESRKNLEEQKRALETTPAADGQKLQEVTTALAAADVALAAATVKTSATVTDNQNTIASSTAALIRTLDDPDEQVRRKARTDLALLGQPAVPYIMDELAKPNLSYRKRYGIVLALKFMRQPISIEPGKIKTLVAFFGSDELDIRKTTGAFLMDLWDANTINAAFDLLQGQIKPSLEADDNYQPSESEKTKAYYAALIVGTWARNLVPNIPSKTGVPMRQFCLTAATEWRNKLSNKKSLGAVKSLLDELVAMASRANSTLVAVSAPVAPVSNLPAAQPTSQLLIQTSQGQTTVTSLPPAAPATN
jgi:hypothetical protein